MKTKLIASLLWILVLMPGVRVFAAPQDNWKNYSNLIWTLSQTPRGIATAPNGRVYVGVQSSPQKIQIFNQDGTFVSEFGSFTTTGIGGIACDASSNVFVFDTGARKVQVFNANGTFLREWGSTGSGDGQFGAPAGGSSGIGDNRIGCDSAGNVYVVDQSNFRIQKFTSAGVFLLKWGSSGALAGQFGGVGAGPVALAVAPRDRVIVSSSGWLQSFDASGTYMERVSLSLNVSVGRTLTLLPDGLIASSAGSSISLFNYDGLTSAGSISQGLGNPNSLGSDLRGRLYLPDSSSTNKRLVILERSYQTENKPVYNALPQPLLLGSAQRAGTSFVDIDYKVVDTDDAAVQTAALGFLNGLDDLGSIVKLSTFVEGTGANLGLNRPTNTTLRLSWNAAADWAVDFGNVQIEILAKDARGLQPFHWITLPANGVDPAVQVSHRPLPDSELLSIWYWLIATNDPAISLASGKVYGVGGSYDGLLLADNTATTSTGRMFLYQRLNVRAIGGAEIVRATAGRYGFQSVDPTYSVVKGLAAPNTHLYAWGDNSTGQTALPLDASGVAAVAVGGSHSLRLSGGLVSGWGSNSWGEITIPAGLTGVTAIAAGNYHSLALKNDGTVVAWGYNGQGQTTIPAGLTGVTAIAAGLYHSLALKSDGTVVAWGDNRYGQTTIPAGLTGVTAIAAGGYHSLALKNDGTVVAWGFDGYGEVAIPAGLTGVTAIAAGLFHSLALKNDHTVVAWGDNTYGQRNIPAAVNSIDILAAGPAANHCLVLDR